MLNLIEGNGFNVEQHNDIETEDGYLLTIFRIHGKDGVRKKPPVLLMHGFLGSSESFVISGKNNCLAFYLADLGFDVWLGNSRGNYHSLKHVKFDPVKDKSKYWDFSFHEIGYYDIPAMIDYITFVTSYTQLYYIGHSQGCAAIMITLSELRHYNDNIICVCILAPAVFLKHTESKSLKLFQLPGFLSTAQRIGSMFSNFQSQSDVLRKIKSGICKVSPSLMGQFYAWMTSSNLDQIDNSTVVLMAATTPAGASTKQFYHFAQLVKSGKFQKYDYGSSENLRRYGKSTPPEYELKNVVTPIGVFYSKTDHIVPYLDVETLIKTLPHVVYEYRIPLKYFSHRDFVYGRDARKYVYKRCKSVMEYYL